MSVLRDDIAAFDVMKADLEAQHFGEWAVFRAGVLAFLRHSFDEAATEALEKFAEGPYLIPQVGASGVNLPASVMYRPANG